MRQVVFILAAFIAFSTLLKPKTSIRNLLFLLSFYYIFSVAWVFYHYTGVHIVDFPLLLLIFLGINSKKKFKFYLPEVSFPLVGIIFWAVITTLTASNKGWAIAELSKIIRGYLIFVCVANHVKDRVTLQAIIYGILMGVGFEGLLAIWQWRIGPTHLWFLGENYHYWRATGTFFVPHYLGNYLIFLLPLIFRLFAFFKPQKKVWTKIYGIIFSVGVMGLFITFGRGAWLAFVTASAVMIMFSLTKSKYRPKVKWAISGLVLASTIFFIHYIPTILSQFGEDRQAATNIRFDQFRIALRIIKANPIFGTGLENYELVSPKYVFDYELEDPRSWQFSEMVHNSYLYFTAQTGIPATILLLIAMIRFLKLGFKIARSKNSYIYNLGIGILTGFLAIAIALFSAPDIRSEQLLMQSGILAGLLYSLCQIDKNLKKQIIVKKMMDKNSSYDNNFYAVNLKVR